METRHVVGVMSGTSIDGVDAALLRLEGSGLDLRATLLSHVARPFGALASPLREAAEQAARPASSLARLGWTLGEFHADVIAALCADEGSPPIDFIAVHGQTIYHRPPHSWQLINPWPIVARLRCPVVCDLRQADLAAGGQGASITPIADWILYRKAGLRRAIVNLGGFCNVSIVRPADQDEPDVAGADVCPCNHVLDRVARTALGRPFDEDGAAATRGNVNEALAERLADALSGDVDAERMPSLGTSDEAHGIVSELLASLSGDDQAATAVTAVARCIAQRVRSLDVNEVIIAGGGARNAALIAALRAALHSPVILSDEIGIPVEAREAMAMAVLGTLCADGIPITRRSVTGRGEDAPIAGAWCGIKRR